MRKNNMNWNSIPEVLYRHATWDWDMGYISGISRIVMKRLCLGLKPEKANMVPDSMYNYGNMAPQIDLKLYFRLGI